MRPKFEVGELVILQSVSRPECAGEFTVTQINCGPKGYEFWFEGRVYSHGESTVSYFLDDPYHGLSGKFKACWDESALRKKHTPGELSYKELVASLSSPKLLTHQDW